MEDFVKRVGAREMPHPMNPKRSVYRTNDGTELIETRNHTGYVLDHGDVPLPFVISMTGTGHTASRQWMFAMNSKRLRSFVRHLGYEQIEFPDRIADSFAASYRLKTKYRKNAFGEFFNWVISDVGWVTEEQYELGKSLFDAMDSGARVMDTPDLGERDEEVPF